MFVDKNITEHEIKLIQDLYKISFHTLTEKCDAFVGKNDIFLIIVCHTV